MRTGMIGLGAMGFPIAINLHKAGHLHCIWNRTYATADTLVAHCDLILISVSADGDVRQIINALLPTLAADTIIVDTSTVSAGTAREMAHRLPPKARNFWMRPSVGAWKAPKTRRWQ